LCPLTALLASAIAFSIATRVAIFGSPICA
jgi:hypothetical protein